MSLEDDRILTSHSLFLRAELRAERLIAWLRLGVSTTLAITFAGVIGPTDLSLVELSEESDLRRWQIIYALGTMAAYFLLGTVCLILLHTNRFSSWMVWPSAMGDCAFLLVGIWLGLKNTGLTGEHIVVMPSLWLIPVVFATGVLRFNPGVQMFVLCLVVGGLAVIAFVEPDASELVDRQILEVFFATPPNIMRLVMIALGGIVLVVATSRARALVLRTLAESERRVNLTRYVPAEIAPQLARSGMSALQSGTREDMAIMFVDMRGFTSRAESMEPEELGQFVTEYRRRVTECARSQGGIIDKFMGDAVMIVFGPDQTHPTTRAITCGQTILRAIADWRTATDENIAVGIGIHWGEVFSGVVGDEERLEYSVFGDAVNIAARLEELTKSSGVEMIISEQVLQNADTRDENWRALPSVELRGRRASISLYGWVS